MSERAAGRADRKMVMGVHEAPGVAQNLVSRDAPPQRVEKHPPVGILLKERRPFDAGYHYVGAGAGDGDWVLGGPRGGGGR